MKSWGARLVAGLKNWRTRNSDAAPDQTPDAGRGEQPDLEPIEKTSIKATLTDFDEEASRANQQVDPGKPFPDVQRADHTEPKPLETASGQLEQTDRETDKPSSSISGLKRLPKKSGAGTAGTGGQLTTGKEPAAQKGATADEILDSEVLVNGGTTRPDQEPKKPVTGNVLTKRSGKASGKAVSRTGLKSPSEVLQERSTDPLSLAREAREKNAATPVVDSSLRSRLRKPETSDDPVTDEDLAELEAENARLKLLLREKLTRR